MAATMSRLPVAIARARATASKLNLVLYDFFCNNITIIDYHSFYYYDYPFTHVKTFLSHQVEN